VVAIQCLGGPTIPWSYGRPDYFAVPHSSGTGDGDDKDGGAFKATKNHGVDLSDGTLASKLVGPVRDHDGDSFNHTVLKEMTANDNGRNVSRRKDKNTTFTTTTKGTKQKYRVSGSDFRFIFHDFGFSEREVVALSGANALARCHGTSLLLLFCDMLQHGVGFVHAPIWMMYNQNCSSWAFHVFLIC
jgi:hypothetical protein